MTSASSKLNNLITKLRRLLIGLNHEYFLCIVKSSNFKEYHIKERYNASCTVLVKGRITFPQLSGTGYCDYEVLKTWLYFCTRDQGSSIEN